MEFQVLSHACLLVRTAQASLIIDPWLLGSCYWRSWWHFPAAQFDEAQVRAVDAVVISHVHWDHWHGPTLKRLLRGKPIFVPDEPGQRSERDLRSIGFTQVHRLPHAQTVCIGDIKLTLYQFGLYINDSAMVIEADGVCLLNANDAKIAGWPLKHLLKRHPQIDFAFRSHSSANPRACFEVENQGKLEPDAQDQYFKAFCAFMDAVRPRYAVPFASNHCHLHEDTAAFNVNIANPLQLREFAGQSARQTSWDLAVMLPGSMWDSKLGFQLAPEDCFTDLPKQLAFYQDTAKEALANNGRYENQVEVDDKLFERFAALVRSIKLPPQTHGHVLVTLHWPDGRGLTKRINLPSGQFVDVPVTFKSTQGLPLAIFPAVIFRDAIVKNMFHHACISKRCRFLGQSNEDLMKLRVLMVMLEYVELGRFPFSWSYTRRLLRAYWRRWREPFVYVHALWLLKVRRLPLFQTEEAILRGRF
jgi:UDP-MurNAc hydroxylase